MFVLYLEDKCVFLYAIFRLEISKVYLDC